MTSENKALLVIVIAVLVAFLGWVAVFGFAPSAPFAPSPPASSCGVPECLTIRALSGTWDAASGTQVYAIPAASMSAAEPFNLTYAGAGTSATDCVYVYAGLNDTVYSGQGGAWRVELSTPVSLCPGQAVTVQATFHIDDLANPGGTIVGNSALFLVAPSYSANAFYGVPSQVVWAGLTSIHLAFQASA